MDRRSRSISPDRRRDRDRDRYRGRDRRRDDRDRSPRRVRDRDYYDDYDRDRDYDRRRYRDRRDSYSRYGRGDDRRDRDWDYRDDRRREFRDERRYDPSSVVMIKGFPLDCTEDDISQALESRGSGPLKDVRLIRDKATGLSRGFAFVEFLTLKDSVRVVDSCDANPLRIFDKSCVVEYSKPKGSDSSSSGHDWTCAKCDTQNFKWRDMCFSCQTRRTDLESQDPPLDGQMESGINPTNVLIFRGLDALSTETTINDALSAQTALPIKDVRLIKDRLMGTSRGFCFVELSSVQEASQLLESLQMLNPPFTIDGRTVTMAYARQPTVATGAAAKNAVAAIEQAQWSQAATVKEADTAEAYAAGFRAAQAAVLAGYQAATNSQLAQPESDQPCDAEAGRNQTADTAAQAQRSGKNAAAQQALESAQAMQKTGQTDASSMSGADVSSYVYDEQSGFYYNQSTGLYYDPKTQYHYNPKTAQYCYYDAEKGVYVPVPSTTEPTEEKKEKKKKEKGDKPMSARKIARDMERWAKSLNAAKDATKAALAAAEAARAAQEANQQMAVLRSTMEAPAKPAAPASLQLVREFEARYEQTTAGKKASSSFIGVDAPAPLDFAAAASSAPAPAPTASSVTAASRASDSVPIPEGADPDPSHTDWKLMACLLCKRKFPDQASLVRHQQMSDLHKQNLAAKRRSMMSDSELSGLERAEREAKYRDRAAERRNVHGISEPPRMRKKRSEENDDSHAGKGSSSDGPVAYEQPTRHGLGRSNKGSQMMQAMGWNEGQGLGRSAQGMVDPLQAQMRASGAGLGSRGSTYGAYISDSRRETMARLTQARFQEADYL